MSDLRELRERCEKATGPDRDIDNKLYWWFCANASEQHQGKTSVPVPTYSASIDAALALVEKALPGWAFGFDRGPETCIAFVDPHDFANRFTGARYTATAPTGPLALLVALLRALEAKP